jgi:hypothetical protein
MLFGVHNYYNNNIDYIGDFSSPGQFGGRNVFLTDQGIAIFNLDKSFDIQEKMQLTSAINDELKKEFGQGLSFATSASSDCVEWEDMQIYYDNIRNMNPNLKTFFVDAKICGEWTPDTEAMKADHLVDEWSDTSTAEQFIGILKPSESDIADTKEDRTAMIKKLEKVYAEAVKSLSAPSVGAAGPATGFSPS